MQTDVKTNKVTEVESNLPSEMLKEAMEAKFGKENVELKTEDGKKKLVVKNGDKETEFSLGEDADTATKDSENRDAKETKENNGVSAEGDPDVDKKPSDGSDPKDFSEDQGEMPNPEMKVTDAVNELGEAKEQLANVTNELKNKVEDPDSDPEEIKDLKEERDRLEKKVENFSRVLAPVLSQMQNFSANQDGTVNFSEGEYMFSKDGQDYYFSDSDDENVFIKNAAGEEFMCSHENFSKLVDEISEEVNFSNKQIEDYLSQFNFSNEQGNFTCIAEDEGHRYFSNDEGEQFEQDKTPEEIQAWRDYQDELDDQAANAGEGNVNPDDVTPPEDNDNNGKVEIDPEKFYVVSVKGNEDGSADLAIGQVYLTKEGAEAEAGAVSADEGETIEVLKGDELLEKYGSAFEPETQDGQEVNNCGVNCSDDDDNKIPVAVTDTNSIPVTDLEKGDKVITPYGDEGELLEDIKPDTEEAKVYIPADDKVVEVPMDEFRKNFSAIVSIHDYINQTNFSEGSEPDSAAKSEDKPAEDGKDAEKKEEKEKVAKAEEELEKLKKDEAEKSIDGNKATIAEVKAVAKNEVEKQKDDIIQQAAQETVAAIAPALQGQGQPEVPTEQAPAPDQGQAAPVEAGAEGAQPQGEPAPTPEEVAAAQAAQAAPAQTPAPVEGQPAAEDQGQQVNHSLLLASANAGAMRNFSRSGMSSYSSNLAACYRRGKQAN